MLDHTLNGGSQVLSVEHLLSLLIDHRTLGVHNIIVFQHVLTGLEIAAFHRPLGIFNGIGQKLGINRRVLIYAEGIHHAHDPLRAEQAHHIVFQGQEETGLAGISLTAGTATELIVDSAGFMALCSHNKQTACIFHLFRFCIHFCLVAGIGLLIGRSNCQHFCIVTLGVGVGLGDELIRQLLLAQIRQSHMLCIASQHNVRTTAGHVGGNGHRAEFAGLSNDLRFLFVVLGVEYRVLHALTPQKFRQQLRLFNGNRAYQHRLPFFVTFLDLPDDRAEFSGLGLIDHVIVVNAGNGFVGGNLHDVNVVNRGEFLFLRQSRARHSGELGIQTEEILEGDGGKGAVLAGHIDPFLGLNGLMQTLVIASAKHQTAGKLVNNDDLTVFDHIVDVPFHHAAGLHRLIDVVAQGGVFNVRQILHREKFFRLGNTAGRQGSGAGFLIHKIVAVQIVLILLLIYSGKDLLPQAGNKEIRHFIELCGLLSLAGDDQRGTGLVDEDGVHLVHDGKIMPPLHHVLLVKSHVVTQIVEAQFVVGAVGNIGQIGLPAFIGLFAVDDQTHLQAQETVDLSHPLRVTLGKVVVDRDNVHAFSCQGIEIGRQNGNQRLALAGLHLRDAPLMKHDAANELHAIGPHAQNTVGSFTADRKSLWQKLVQRFAGLIASLKFLRLFP